MSQSHPPNVLKPAPQIPDDVPHHESPRKKRGMPPAKMQLTLTSMIDVIFLLLVYFVVTANFAVEEGVLTAKLPREGSGAQQQSAEPPKQPVEIQLSSYGSHDVLIRVDNRRIEGTFTALARELASLQYAPDRGRREGVYPPDHPIVIKAGPQVRWQHLVNAYHAAQKERYTNIRFEEPERG